MSDFSSGIMIHADHKEHAKKYMEDGTYLIKINDMWICRLSENDFCEMAEENYSEAVINMSVHVPLMHVMNAEDHGFGLGILYNKKLIFHFHITYAVESEFAFNIGRELYGDGYMNIIFDTKVQAKVQSEIRRRYHEIEERLDSFFSGIDENRVAQFKLFGFDNGTCAKIKNVLTKTNYKIDGIGHQMIDELFSILKLSGFHFVSHRYVDPHEGIFDIIE